MGWSHGRGLAVFVVSPRHGGRPGGLGKPDGRPVGWGFTPPWPGNGPSVAVAGCEAQGGVLPHRLVATTWVSGGVEPHPALAS